MRNPGIACVVIAVAMHVGSASAAEFQREGYVRNHGGEKCLYTQRTDAKSRHFHGSITGEMGTITFEDSKCMSEGPGGQDINIMMINNVIASLYYASRVQPDAAFQTRSSELLPSSLLQKKGKCMQSKTYPTIGVTLDYELKNGAIAKVRHGSAVDGCKK